MSRGHVKGEPLTFIHGHQSGMPRHVRKADWSTNVMGYLVAEKRRGETDFNAAWRRAMKLFPPRARDIGDATPALFSLDGESDVSVVEFAEFVAGQAWHDYVGPEPGQGKALARFTPDVLVAMNDSSEPAGRAWRMEAA